MVASTEAANFEPMKSQTIGSDGSGGWSWLPALCRGCVQVLTLAMLLLVCMPSVIELPGPCQNLRLTVCDGDGVLKMS